MSQTETPLAATQTVSPDSAHARLPATNIADDPAADSPEVPVDHIDDKSINDVVQPLDPEVQNDKERQADAGAAEAEVVNLQGTDNTPKEPKEPDADTAKNTQLATTSKQTNAPPTDLGPRERSAVPSLCTVAPSYTDGGSWCAVPSQGSNVGSMKLLVDTAKNALDGKTDHKDKVEDSGGSDNSDAPVRFHPESRAALTKKLKEDRTEAKKLEKVLRNAKAKVVSRLLRPKPIPDRISLPEYAVQNAVTFTEEECDQAKIKIELAREGIKDVHVPELDWDKRLECPHSPTVNRK